MSGVSYKISGVILGFVGQEVTWQCRALTALTERPKSEAI